MPLAYTYSSVPMKTDVIVYKEQIIQVTHHSTYMQVFNADTGEMLFHKGRLFKWVNPIFESTELHTVVKIWLANDLGLTFKELWEKMQGNER